MNEKQILEKIESLENSIRYYEKQLLESKYELEMYKDKLLQYRIEN